MRANEPVTFSSEGEAVGNLLKRLFRYLVVKNYAFEFSDEELTRVFVLKKPGTDLALLEKQMVEKETETEPVYGVKILHVVEGHQGEELGLNNDDIILEYDGVRINYASSLVKEVKEKTDKEQVTVTVLRYGKPMQFALRGGFMGVRITTVKVPKEEYEAYLAGQ
jgi:hypothetical protein